jgi:hypothetical protein
MKPRGYGTDPGLSVYCTAAERHRDAGNAASVDRMCGCCEVVGAECFHDCHESGAFVPVLTPVPLDALRAKAEL